MLMFGGGQFQEPRVGVPRSHRNNHNGGHSAEAGGPWPKGIGAASLPADAAEAEVGVSTWIAGVSRQAGRPGDGIHCDDSARLTRSGPLDPSPVATAAGKGGGAAAAGAQLSWVRR